MISLDQLLALHVAALACLSCFHHLVLQEYTLRPTFDLVSQHTCQGIELLTVSNLVDNLIMHRNASFLPMSTMDVPIQRVEEG